MARKELREDKIRRIIEITAEHLGRQLSEMELLEILDRCQRPGRPPRRRWTDEQVIRLERMRLDLLMKREDDPTSAARTVAKDAPFAGKAATATFHWLRRYFAEYRNQAAAAELRRSLLAGLRRDPATGQKKKS